MKFTFKNLYKNKVQPLILLSLLIGLVGCSGNAKRSASPYFLDNIAKFSGKFSVYISEEELVNNSIIESQDCESWQIQIELDKAYKESIKNKIQRMFDNV